MSAATIRKPNPEFLDEGTLEVSLPPVSESTLAERFARSSKKDIAIDITTDRGLIFQLALMANAPTAGEKGNARYADSESRAMALLTHLIKPHVRVMVAHAGNHVLAGLWIDEHGKSQVFVQDERLANSLRPSLDLHYLETLYLDQVEAVH